MKNKTKSIFDWLKEITWNKSPVEEFTDYDWEKNFNSYLIHRYISMNPYYTEIANYLQQFHPDRKREIYSAYRELIPKQKVYLKYIKGKKNITNKEIIEQISSHFECSFKEAEEYLQIFSRKEIESILTQRGIEEKEIKKWLKNHPK